MVHELPGTAQEKAKKAAFMDRCTSCHTYERIAKSTYDTDGFIKVLQRMGTYAPGTTPYEPQKRKESRAEMNPERLRPRAEFLASINLSEFADLGLSAEDPAEAYRPIH